MNDVELQYLGQTGFVVRWDDLKICFDLYLSNSVYELTGEGIRNYEPPVAADSITDLDYYFISHDHLDHLDPKTISTVAKVAPQTKFVVPYPHMAKVKALGVSEENITGAKAYEKIDLGKLTVYPIPEKHEDYGLIDGQYSNLGYVAEYDGFKIFHAGDVIANKKLADDIKTQGRMDVMFVPINGHDFKRFEADIMGNMNYREALDLCDYVGTELVVPTHYDLFKNNTENPGFFVDYLYREYPAQKFKMFIPGETVRIVYERQK